MKKPFLQLLLLSALMIVTPWLYAANQLDVYPLPAPPAPKKLTLDDAVWLALRYNPDVQNSAIDRVVQKYNLVVARNQFELQYALQATSNSTYTHVTQSGGGSNSNTYSLTPSASLNLPSGGTITTNVVNTLNGASSGGTYNPQLNVTVTQHLMRGFGSAITLTPLADAYDAERVNQLSLRQTVSQTIVKVISDYYAVLANQENIVTQKMALDNATQRIEQNKIKIKAGTIPPSDNVQAEADLAQAQYGYSSALNTLTQSKLTLMNDIGLAPDENIIIDDHLNSSEYPEPPLEDAKRIVLANDTSYQTSLINYRVAQRALQLAKDNQRAQLDLTVSNSSGSSSGNGSNSGLESMKNGSNSSSSIGLSLTVPIDDVKANYNTLEAKATLQKDNDNLRTAAWALEAATINAINNIHSLKAQLAIAKTSVDTQQQALNLAEIKRKYGTGSALDVSIQQTNLTNARLNYTTTQIGYLTSMLQFRQLLGKTLEDWHVQMHY